MKYIVVGDEAADQIASNRTLQSIDFDQANQLVDVLTGGTKYNQFDIKVALIYVDDGVYFLSNTKKSTKYLVFDLGESRIFDNKSNKDVIILFQKTVRFALRYWNKLAHPMTERHIQDSTKSVIFPFPFTTSSAPPRIVIEESPDKRRAERRDIGNMFLLVYKLSTDDGAGKNEEAPTTNYRKAITCLNQAYLKLDELRQASLQQPEISSFCVTKLDNIDRPIGVTSLGFSNWLEILTVAQKAFVKRAVSGPEKIEGPAGTGKTLSLILKCINNLIECEKLSQEHHSLFITHSNSTKKTIEDIFVGNDASKYLCESNTEYIVGVTVTTLHEWCVNNIRVNISETELIDRDAMDSKDAQLLYIVQAFDEAMSNDFTTYKKILSNEFAIFLEKESPWNICEMLQHEISIMIKGRADEDLERYKKLERIQYGLPLNNEYDIGFVFMIFTKYRKMLNKISQYDTDDVILTAIGHLDTPIWRRIKEKEGFDSIFIDETHLFNINELSVFHHLIKDVKINNIIFSLDTSQATGDRGISSSKYCKEILKHDKSAIETNVKAVFRCSPDIVNLAFSVTSSGASLFTNFYNPLELATSTFTEAEERKSELPQYYLFTTDDEMIENAFKHAENIVDAMSSQKSDVLLVPFSTEIFNMVKNYAVEHNKPVELLKNRGDMEVVNKAKKSGRFVLGAPDYVGGLEFDGVILIGVDDGRVPPTNKAMTEDSIHYLTYTAHNRLYVAITRARYRVEILGNKSYGVCNLFQNAIAHKFIEIQ
ncbi:hypothetical protein F6V30_00725 [Oryzomonas sagensis]|uniref:DNA 3'-5' helicase II n=1 Tax=Oryzomonas sagensis TaxID=2603857 RepID=A0ABQ6TQ66_9BACT|nr:UvrD-helicase domain-containing protein [Oryzomonas sagensis]KAB0671150.1 hypothetical protein F6V30_00725 [Oryzomonas sagensis]